MTIRDRVIAVIASQPGGVGLQMIRAQLHDCSHGGVHLAVSDPCRKGLIERVAHGRYRPPAPKQTRISMPVADGFVRGPSLARLMAGR